MEIKKSRGCIEIVINEQYSLKKYRGLNLWWLQYYNFGKNYMPMELECNNSLVKIYQKAKKLV